MGPSYCVACECWDVSEQIGKNLQAAEIWCLVVWTVKGSNNECLENAGDSRLFIISSVRREKVGDGVRLRRRAPIQPT